MKLSIRSRVAIAATAVALLATACGSDDSSSSTTAAAAAPSPTTAAASTATTKAPADDGYGTPAATTPATTAKPATTATPGTTATPATTAGGTASGAGVSVDLADTSLGSVLTSDGLTLYMFTPDNSSAPTCVDACAAAWPPLMADSAPVAGDGLTAADLTTVARPDGTMQVAYHGWPLYFYAEDAKAGDVIGQGVGDKWFVLGADGTPIKG